MTRSQWKQKRNHEGFFVLFFFPNKISRILIYRDCVLGRLHCFLLISLCSRGSWAFFVRCLYWVVWSWTSRTLQPLLWSIPPLLLKNKYREWLSNSHLCASVTGKIYFYWEKNVFVHCPYTPNHQINNFKQSLQAFFSMYLIENLHYFFIFHIFMF